MYYFSKVCTCFFPQNRPCNGHSFFGIRLWLCQGNYFVLFYWFKWFLNAHTWTEQNLQTTFKFSVLIDSGDQTSCVIRRTFSFMSLRHSNVSLFRFSKLLLRSWNDFLPFLFQLKKWDSWGSENNNNYMEIVCLFLKVSCRLIQQKYVTN